MESVIFKFSVLKISEIQETAELVAKVFSMFDPFIFQLKISKEELLESVINDLKFIVDDGLVLVAKDEKGEIIGCYAGFKLSKLDLYSSNKNNFKLSKSLIFKGDKEGLSLSQKMNILEEIDFCLLKQRYDIHKEKNQLEESIFCDYYCISDNYFQSNLAKELALHFFLHNHKMGIKHIYGSFFNIKAVKLMTKYFPAEIVNEIKVVFEDKDEKEEYTILLLYGDAKSISQIKPLGKF